LLRSRLEQFERSHAAKRPLHKLNEMRQELDEYQSRLLRGLDSKQKHAQQMHSRLNAHLNALNPKAILGRGYSITFDASSGKIVRRANETILGQPLKIVLGEGAIDANVASANAFVVAKQTRKPRGATSTVIEWFGDVEELAPAPAASSAKKRARTAD
jgi:exonuclease VII large subunit